VDLGRWISRFTERGELTDEQWAALEPLLPKSTKAGRAPRWTRRQLIDGLRWRTRAGEPWRDVPQRYGPWERAYDLFRRWQRDGTWKQIFERLQAEADAKGLITWDVSVEPMVSRAHQHAAGARKWGRSRRSLPAVSTSSPTTTVSGARVAG
jgi:transposase